MKNIIKMKNENIILYEKSLLNINNINRNKEKIHLKEGNIKQNEFTHKKIIEKKTNLIKNNKQINKTNIKIKIFNINNSINILFMLNLLIIFLSVSISEDNLRKLQAKNEIVLTIMGNGAYQSIIHERIPLPSEVIIDGEKREIVYSNSYLLTKSEHTVIIKWDFIFNNCENMFYGLNNILTIDFSNFDSSQVTSMHSMFHGCLELKSINFNNIKTSLVKDMEDMFYACNSLISLDLTNFDTSLVTSMRNMFSACKSLVSLDLSSFKTDSLQNMELMFKNDESLISLDLSNFNTASVTLMSDTFASCKSLIFINLKSFVENPNIQNYRLFEQIPSSLIYCIDNAKTNKIFTEIQSISSNNDCNNVCFSEIKKIILDKKKCIDDCKNDDTYVYECNNICYNTAQQKSENGDIITIATQSNVQESKKKILMIYSLMKAMKKQK